MDKPLVLRPTVEVGRFFTQNGHLPLRFPGKCYT